MKNVTSEWQYHFNTAHSFLGLRTNPLLNFDAYIDEQGKTHLRLIPMIDCHEILNGEVELNIKEKNEIMKSLIESFEQNLISFCKKQEVLK